MTDPAVPRNLYHDARAQWAMYLLFFVALAALPLLITSAFVLNQVARYCVFGMLAVSVCLVWGYGGILSLGQGLAFGLASYGMGMLMQLQSQDAVSNPVPSFMLSNDLETLPALWEPFWHAGTGLTLALAVPTLFFTLFGMLMFQARVAGVYVAIMTLAMLSAVYSIVYDLQPYTGGFSGIAPAAPLHLGGVVFDPYTPFTYWTVLALLAAVAVGTKLLLASKFGVIVRAIREDSERARFLGYSVSLYQTVVFTISALIAAIAGLCWVALLQFVSPTALEVGLSITMVVWSAVGGRYSVLGSVIGAFLVNGTQSYLGDQLLYAFTLVLGALFIVVVRFMPKGLAGLLESVLGRFTKAKA